MMTYQEFAGNKGLVAGLFRSIETGKSPHALIFVGPQGSGKKSLSMLYARALLCQGQGNPCNTCPSCGKVLSSNHPDLFVIFPEKKRKTIGVEAILSLQRQAVIKPNEGGRKVFIIPHAQILTEEAQNKLLKILEEPPHYLSILLLCENTAALLPTVLSRCMKFKMPVVSEEEIQRILIKEGIDATRAKKAAIMARGIVGRALTLCKDEAWLQEVKLAADLLFRLDQAGGHIEAFHVLNEDRNRGRRILLIWQSLLRDGLMVSAGHRDHLEHPDELKRLIFYTKAHGGEGIIHRLDRLLETERRLNSSAQYPLSIDWLLSAI